MNTPDAIEANIVAEASPAASAMRIVIVISCPAPFERLEVLMTPTIHHGTTLEVHATLVSYKEGKKGAMSTPAAAPATTGAASAVAQ